MPASAAQASTNLGRGAGADRRRITAGLCRSAGGWRIGLVAASGNTSS